MAHKARTSTVVPSHDVIKEKKILSDIRAQVAESQQEYERSVQLKSDTTDLQNEHDRLCTEVAKRKSEIDSLKKKSEELEASHRDSEAKLATVNAHLDSQESVLKLRGDIENDLGRISGELQEKEESIGRVRDIVNGLKKQKEELELDLRSLRYERSQVVIGIGKVSSEYSKARVELSVLTEKAFSLEGDIRDLKKNIQSLTTEKENMIQDIEKMNGRIGERSGKTEESFQDRRKDLEKIEKDISDISSVRDILASEVSSFKKEKKKIEDDISALQKELLQKNSEFASLTKQVDKKKKELESVLVDREAEVSLREQRAERRERRVADIKLLLEERHGKPINI